MNFINRESVITNIASLIVKKRQENTPLIVGITGVDTSGKTQLTNELKVALINQGYQVQVVHVDDFHNEKAIRYANELSEPDQYYYRSIDFEKIARDLLQLIKKNRRLETTINHLNLDTDTWTYNKKYLINPQTIVLLEGVFIYRDETRPFIDTFIHLHVDEAIVLERAQLRDKPKQGEEVIRKYHAKYLPAQRRYLEKYNPCLIADVIVENSNWEKPKILKWPENFQLEA